MGELCNRTDSELFGLLKQGNQMAFEAVYKRYYVPLLNASFGRLNCREAATEVVQDVFMQLYLNRDQIGHSQNLLAYLHTALRNKTAGRTL